MKKETAFFAQFSTQQLEEMLRLGLSRPESNYDEVLLQIMEVLNQREKKRRDEEIINKAWEKFQAYYNTPEMRGVELYGDSEEMDKLFGKRTTAQEKEAEKEEKVVPIRSTRRVRGLFKTARIVAATLVLTFCFTVVAQAAGYDFYGIMGTYTKNFFQFRTSGNTPTPEQQKASKEIQAEINAIGVYQDLVPTWWPEGFEVYELKQENVEGEFDSVVCGYENKNTNNFFSYTLDVYYNSSWLTTPFEKDDTPMEIYESNGRSFYIMSNIDTLTATWSDGTIVLTVGGQLTKDEIKGILDSIGG